MEESKTIPTIEVVHPDPAMAAKGETMIINKEDFDKSKHQVPSKAGEKVKVDPEPVKEEAPKKGSK